MGDGLVRELRDIGRLARVSWNDAAAADIERLADDIEGEFDRHAVSQAHLHEARQDRDAARASLAERQWQPIETAPREGQRVIGWIGARAENVAWCAQRRGWYRPGTMGLFVPETPTHWVPVPAGPEVDDG